MPEWYDIADEKDFPNNTHRVVEIADQKLIVSNIDGKFFAVQDICTHDGGILSDGEFINNELVCPRHGARFSAKTGEVLAPPAYEPIETYPLRIIDGKIQVQI